MNHPDDFSIEWTQPSFTLDGWHKDGEIFAEDGSVRAKVYVNGNLAKTDGQWEHIAIVYGASISNVRVTRGKALYRLPWWKRWLMPWTHWRFYRTPTTPFPITTEAP